MDLTPHVEQIRGQLAVAAEAGGEDARALAERLTPPLESAIRLTLLDPLSAAPDQTTRGFAPRSGDLPRARPRIGGAAAAGRRARVLRPRAGAGGAAGAARAGRRARGRRARPGR